MRKSIAYDRVATANEGIGRWMECFTQRRAANLTGMRQIKFTTISRQDFPWLLKQRQ